MCDGLCDARGDTIQDDITQVVVSRLGMTILHIDIVQVLLYSTCLFKITNVVESSVWLILVGIIFPNGILDFFSSIVLILVRRPSFQRISFCPWANVGQLLYLVAGLRNGEIIVHLQDLSF